MELVYQPQVQRSGLWNESYHESNSLLTAVWNAQGMDRMVGRQNLKDGKAWHDHARGMTRQGPIMMQSPTGRLSRYGIRIPAAEHAIFGAAPDFAVDKLRVRTSPRQAAKFGAPLMLAP